MMMMNKRIPYECLSYHVVLCKSILLWGGFCGWELYVRTDDTLSDALRLHQWNRVIPFQRGERGQLLLRCETR